MANNNTNSFGAIRSSFSRMFLGTTVDNTKRDEEQAIINKQTLVAVENDEAADLIDISHFQAAGYLTQNNLQNQADIINEYRAMSVHAEVDRAIDDIINEMVTSDADEKIIKVEISDTESISESTKHKISTEFDYLLHLLRFDFRAYEISRQWYVDGKLFYHKIIDQDVPKKGILKLVNLDARATKRIKEVTSAIDPDTRIEKVVGTRSYYLYDPTYINSLATGDNTTTRTSINRVAQALEISEDAITFVHSGIISGDANNLVLSHLEKARKPLNNLRMLEDAVVIYRITRAPERRIFYVDVGSLQKKSAEEYMMALINKYRTKLVYDGQTGKVKGNSHQISMMEDYWLPRREGGRGTEISTLPAGENLNQIEDLRYFQKNLLKSLNVPQSRLESEATISIGNRATEINRDEIKFNKFVQRLRRRFNGLFLDLLRTQLILKGITTSEDWDSLILPNIRFNYASDLFIKEEQEAQIMESRLSALEQADPYVGKYYSKESVQKRVLRMTDDQIAYEAEVIKKEIANGDYMSQEDQSDMDAGIHDDQIAAQKELQPKPAPTKGK